MALAADVRFERDSLCVTLTDGRTVSAPVAWFPKLRDASDTQRANWHLIGGGIGIHWPDLDEDVSVEGLLVS